MRKLKKEMPVEELVESHPGVVDQLQKRGILCIRCGEPVWGTLEDLLKRKGIEDIDGFVDSLDIESRS